MDEIAYITEHSTALAVEETSVRSCIEALPIKAVLFDIYGTLMISASGDIGVANKLSKNDAFVAAVKSVYGYEGADVETALLLDGIAADHAQSRAQGIPFPEVKIDEIWQGIATQLDLDSDVTLARQAAIVYECATNPVWPMPNLEPCLAAVRALDIQMGIISNAQFYTPLLFSALTEHDLTASGFDPDLRWYSYGSKRAKPDTWMYEQARCALAKRGIEADEVLYVGNDMLNDMLPASQVGFKTALFAGDKRSLRLREDHEQAAQVQVDCIITDLSQLQEII